MSSTAQTLATFAIVLAATVYLLLRWKSKRAKPGCSDDCGCPSSELRSKHPH